MITLEPGLLPITDIGLFKYLTVKPGGQDKLYFPITDFAKNETIELRTKFIHHPMHIKINIFWKI